MALHDKSAVQIQRVIDGIPDQRVGRVLNMWAFCQSATCQLNCQSQKRPYMVPVRYSSGTSSDGCRMTLARAGRTATSWWLSVASQCSMPVAACGALLLAAFGAWRQVGVMLDRWVSHRGFSAGLCQSGVAPASLHSGIRAPDQVHHHACRRPDCRHHRVWCTAMHKHCASS